MQAGSCIHEPTVMFLARIKVCFVVIARIPAELRRLAGLLIAAGFEGSLKNSTARSFPGHGRKILPCQISENAQKAQNAKKSQKMS